MAMIEPNPTRDRAASKRTRLLILAVGLSLIVLVAVLAVVWKLRSPDVSRLDDNAVFRLAAAGSDEALDELVQRVIQAQETPGNARQILSLVLLKQEQGGDNWDDRWGDIAERLILLVPWFRDPQCAAYFKKAFQLQDSVFVVDGDLVGRAFVERGLAAWGWATKVSMVVGLEEVICDRDGSPRLLDPRPDVVRDREKVDITPIEVLAIDDVHTRLIGTELFLPPPAAVFTFRNISLDCCRTLLLRWSITLTLVEGDLTERTEAAQHTGPLERSRTIHYDVETWHWLANESELLGSQN